MKHLVVLLSLLAPAGAWAEHSNQPQPPGASPDAPWGPVPVSAAPAPTSPEEQLLALADLDGDPSVVTRDEFAMMQVLAQVLGADPTRLPTPVARLDATQAQP
jgi:hypothetical protein